MKWLADRLGLDRMLKCDIVLPEERFFPEPFEGTTECVRLRLNRICGYMGVASDQVNLEIVPAHEMSIPGSAGVWIAGDNGTCTIQISEDVLHRPQALIAVLAHELAHQVLLGHKHQRQDDVDLEEVTDLLTVFLGLGIFPANSAVQSQAWHDLGWEFWQIQKSGYLPSRMLAYAMALQCWMRGDLRADWKAYLTTDPLHEFRAAIKYIGRTEDSWFHPTTAGDRGQRSVDQLIDELGSKSESRVLNAMWDLAEHADGSRAIESLRPFLSSSSGSLREHACAILIDIGAYSDDLRDDYLSLLDDREVGVRIQAAEAIVGCDNVPDLVVEEFGRMLHGSNRREIDAVAVAAAKLGRQAAPLSPHILRALKRAIVACDDKSSAVLAHALTQVVDSPEQEIHDWYAEHPDDELRNRSLAEVEAALLSHSRQRP